MSDREKSICHDHARSTGSADLALRRRTFLASSAAIGVVGALGMLRGATAPALAAKKFEGRKVVFASWGGAYQNAQRDCYCAPFAEKTGATVIQDGPVDTAKFRAMAESSDPVWDVIDVTDGMLFNVAKDGLLEKIDKSAVHTDRISPAYVNDFGIGDIVWSYNIGYSTATFDANNHPRSWAEVFDLKRFPGKRMLNATVAPNMEIALMADGVAPDKLYPLDVDRAFKKLDAIKSGVIFWQTNSQSQQLLTDGEVVCGTILNGRAFDAVKKGAKMAIEWNQNIQSIDYLAIPKGSKNAELAMGLIDEMTVAENQAKLANLIAYSPTNPKAFPAIDADISPWLATNPENVDKGFLISAEYWRDNLQKLQERWNTWKLS